MARRALFLGLNGLYQLADSFQEDRRTKNREEVEGKNRLDTRLPLFISSCFITRDAYWEQVKYYPTTNIFEVNKIMDAERKVISPLPGKTYSYIISLSGQQSIVLYCCFSRNLLEQASKYNLLRLIPESLPLYRNLLGKDAVYHSQYCLEPVVMNNTEIKQACVDCNLMIQISAQRLASLPVSDPTRFLMVAQQEEAQLLNGQQYFSLLKQFHPLKLSDYYAQAINYIRVLKRRWVHIVPSLIIFAVSFCFTIMAGLSLLTLWQHNHLREEVAKANVYALDAVKDANKLKNIKSEIVKINQVLAEHPNKVMLLQKLIVLSKQHPFKLTSLDISPIEIQLRGTTSSAAKLLSALSKTAGFKGVKFINPPARTKDDEERFYITLSYNVGDIL